MNALSSAAALHGAAAAAPAAAVLPIVPADLFLDAREARRIGEELSGRYSFAEPFPHIVLDHFLPDEVARAALAAFPDEALANDRVFDIGYAGHHKRQVLPEDCAPEARRLFHFFNSAPMLQFLEGLSSIQGLIPDPYFIGGGYHETRRGGKLGIHADFRINDRLHLQRRMNVIVYLNAQWDDAWGGQLELWDRQMQRMRVKVAPLFNRCVVFNTDADSYHGHPDPLATPDGVVRRSIALYYYTASHEIYREVPSVSTIYHARPGDDAATRREARRLRLDQHLNQWTPPALQRWVFAIKRRLLR